MSVNGKRVLAPSTEVVPCTHAISSNDLNGGLTENSPKNNDLIGKLAHSLSHPNQIAASGNADENRDTEFDAQHHMYSIDDEEIDEPPVPIPSTWRQSEQDVKEGKIAEQVRSSAYGFLIGLFFVVPTMMLLTSVQTQHPPYWASITEYARSTYRYWQFADVSSSLQRDGDVSTPQSSVTGANDTDTPNPAGTRQDENTKRQTTDNTQHSQGVNSLTHENTNAGRQTAFSSQAAGQDISSQSSGVDVSRVPTGESKEEVVMSPGTSGRNAVAAITAQPTPPGASMEKARAAIRDGKMPKARVMLAKLASLGDSSAMFALAETFDPNVLAAWGKHDEEANTEKAKMFYTMALTKGIRQAKERIEALE